ncbi:MULTISPECIES: nitrate reductase [unclassified Halomonas]|uniref:nitrate reductase n=1 Tax=unclassified Halomonas TaxID=2609666 RepID=UPI0007D9FFF7|nr:MULTISPECIES: nitrate reductase [unclassified Halomonas]MBT2787160.1 molybdopterin-dependent oxidoreductase [Halomonas sp. ISL-106]MBT2795502.1 molybdopterin-dependent oxidoreductase [Halomonas sp. ISL-104]OAL57999.1 nitrate reductase [Halomonas sp. ALS9]
MTQAKTTCPYCGVGCGVTATVEAGTLSAVEGDREHPANFGRLCVKGSALHETLGEQGRLTHPRVDGVEVSWGTALSATADRLNDLRAEHGNHCVAAYLSGQLLTEDYYVANKLFKGFLGTPHLDTNSRLCMASAVVGYKRAFGADAVPCNYEDLEEAELVVLVGSNLAWNHPVLYQRIKVAKERNPLMRLVVIDPRVTDSCEIADLYLGIKPGTDAYLFNGLLTWMAKRRKLDTLYLERHTEGFDEALEAAQQTTGSVAEVAAACDVDPERLETFYYWFASQLHVVTLYSQGVNQSASGTDKCNAIINCHLAGGKIGLPGAGPFSITGQPNAMGGREVGGLANQLAAHMDYHTPGALDLVSRFWATDSLTPSLPEEPGYKAVELFEAIERGEIKALWVMATNPAISLPDAARVRAALEKCPLVIVSECAAHTDLLPYADIVLPASGWSEKDGTVTNSERRISRQRGMLPPPGEARHDWWIMCEVAKRLGFSEAFDYTHPWEIFDEHARLSGFENNGSTDSPKRLFDISGLVGLGRDGYDALAPIQWPVTKAAPHGTARLFEDGEFATANGRAKLLAIHPQGPEKSLCAAYPLRLNTGRIRDQWHTMTRTARSPRLMNHRAEPFMDVHPDDAHSAGVTDQGLAVLTAAKGEFRARVRVSNAQRRGEIFVPIHWTDCFTQQARSSSLIDSIIDPLSGQPESKHGAVALAPLATDWQATLLVAEGVTESTPWCTSAYWTRIPMRGCQRWQLAHTQSVNDWLAQLKTWLPGDVSVVSQDPTNGRLRAACVKNDQLRWWLMVGPPKELPGLAWLEARFNDLVLSDSHRRRLLAGCDDGAADTGPVVCSCHQVGQTTIVNAIREGDTSVEALGARLACGTQCGSCIPELKSLIEEERPNARTKQPLATEVV